MKPYIIPIFIPHYGCKNDCVFCNQFKITGQATPVTPEKISLIVAEHISQRPSHSIEVAFYGGSFTALPLNKQAELLAAIEMFFKRGDIHAVRLSTRPDCIDEAVLELLMRYHVSTIELGVQSMEDDVLFASKRGHTAVQVVKAVELIRQYPFQLGLQFMPGLAQDTPLKMMRTVKELIRLKPHFVRIYPTLVLRETQLATLYLNGAYKPLTLSEAVRHCAVFKNLFRQAGIQVIRTGLQATEELNSGTLLAGPYHPAFGELVDMYLFYIMTERILEQFTDGDVILYHHHKDTSKIRGNKNHHLEVWRQRYPTMRLKLIASEVQRDTIVAEMAGQRYFMSMDLIGNI